MATFTGLYIGTLGTNTPFDPTEGNTTVENPTRLENRVFGSSTNPLYQMSTGSADPGAVNITLSSFDNGGDGLLTQNNAGLVYDEFQVNDAINQYRVAFDMAIRYNATITYANGTTATVQVWVVQAEIYPINTASGSNGQGYIFPDTSAGANATALTAMPIESISLGTYVAGSETSAGLVKASILASDFSYDGVVTGTNGNDLINANYQEVLGSGGADQVDGGDAVAGQSGDNDSILGLGGNDTIYAGEGKDTVSGGVGTDEIHGGSENDSLLGDANNDTIYGDSGNDTINAGTEDDVVYGGDGSDSILGGAGNDNLSGDGASEPGYHSYTGYVFGTNFQDSGSNTAVNYDGMQITGAAVTITLRDDDNILLSDLTGEEQFLDPNQVVLINGVEYKALLEQIVTMRDPATGKTYVFAQLDVDTNGDNIDGGGEQGNVNILLSSEAPPSGATLVAVAGTAVGDQDLTYPPSDYNDTILGEAGNDTITGGAGNDSLDGGADNDSILGNDGADTLLGGITGNDTLLGGSGNDSILGGDGIDQIDGGANNDTINAGVGADLVYGGSGDDTIDGSDGNDLIYGDSNLPGTAQRYEFKAYYFGQNFTDVTAGAAEHYNGGIIATGAPITVTFSDDDLALLTDDNTANGGVNDTFNDTNQTVTINGVTYPVLLEQIVTYQDQFGNTYRFAQLDIDYNRDGIANNAFNLEQGSLQLLLSDTTPPIGAQLSIVAGQTDTTNDLLYDDHWNDSILGGIGADTIYGETGNDTIYGGNDNDVVSGGVGSDSLIGGLGTDSLLGDAGNDTILGEAGNDTIAGGLDNDSLDGGADNDSILGNEGADTLLGGITGNDTLLGGSGNDSILGGDGIDQIDGGANNDTINAGTGADIVYGGSGDDTIDGSDGNDLIYGDSNLPGTAQQYEFKAYYFGQNFTDVTAGAVEHYTGGIITTGAPITVTFSDDDLALLTDDNTANGGVNDTFNDTNQTVTINGVTYPVLLEQIVTYRDQFGNTYRFAQLDIDYNRDGIANNSFNLEQGSLQLLLSNTTPPIGAQLTIVAGQTDTTSDLLYDDHWNDSILGGAGDDTIYGETGNDTIYGGNDNDVISGGVGDDSLIGGLGNDSLSGDAGNDTINAQDGNDTVYGGDGNDSITGFIGDDYIDGGAGADSIHAGPGLDTVLGGDGNDTIDGDIGTDSISGGAGNDMLYGGGDNDTIDGGADNDSINAGTGDDVVLGGTGADTIDGIEGNDSISGGDGNDTLYGGTDNDTIDGGADNDLINAGTGNDLVLGGTGADTIDGGDGNDSINGGDGNDSLVGGAGADTLLGGAGADSIHGGDDNDSVVGDAGNDTLDGGHGSDTLVGGTGNDAIRVGRGDNATGGDDRDTFTLDVSQLGSGTVFTVDGSSGVGTNGDYDQITLAPGLSYAGGWQGTRDADGNSWSGSFEVTDGSTTYTVNFTEIEAPICFARGTEIETVDGLQKIEDLREGDMILTRDNGVKPISWIGSRGIVNDHSENAEKFAPIRISKGSLSNGRPNRDLYVSPQHRILVRSKITRRMFGEDEVLIAAKQLLQIDGIEQVSDYDAVEYFHILFDQHEIVFANGVEAESLHTGPEAMKSLPLEARQEIFAIFPELAEMTAGSSRRLARFSPNGKQARKLAERQQMNGMPLQ